MKKIKKQMPIQGVTATREKNIYGNMFWLLLLSGFLIAGSMLSILQSFGNQLSVSSSSLIAVLVLSLVMCILGTGLREQHSWARWLRVIPWIAMFAMTGFRGYWNGAKLWINLIIARWNQANEGGISLLQTRADDQSMMAFCLLMTVFCCELVWVLVESSRVVYCCLWGLLCLVIQLIGGTFQPLPCGLLLLGILGVWMSGVEQANFRTSIRWMFFAVITLCICLFVEPDADLRSIDEFREEAKQQVKEFRYGTDTLPEGDLSKASQLQAKDDEMLLVKSEQQKTMYFRGYVGGRYKDGVWEPLPDANYGGENAGIMKWLKKHGFDPLTQVSEYYKLSGESQPKENDVRITVSEASRYYMYAPSSLESIGDKRTSENNKDMRLKSKRLFGAKNYSLTECSETRPSELIVTSSWVENPQTKEEKKYSEAEAVYRKFVYDNYTDVDEDLRDVIDDYFWKDYESESDGIYSAVSRIRKCLEEKATYVKEPKNASTNDDPVEYFLLKSGEGNAMDYASVAVEALRAHGIPARYVEGYYLADTAEADKDSGQITLTGQDAHAWAEVYFDGIGWLPIDVTPGYYYDAMELQQLVSAPDASKKNAALENNADDADNVSGNSDGGSKSKGEKIKKAARNVTVLLLGICACLLILIVCLITMIEIARIVCMQRFHNKMKRSTQRVRVRKYRNCLYYLMALRGIEAQLGWNMENADRKLSEIYDDIEPGEYARVCELLEKEIYGEIELEPYEERTIQQFFDKISVARKSDGWKIKLKFRYVYIALARC